ELDHLGRNAAAEWVCRFRSIHPASVARFRLQELRTDDWFDEIIDLGETSVILRRFAQAGLFGRFSGQKSGLEASVLWPEVRGGEVEVTATLIGDPDARFSSATAESMPRIFNEIRSMLISGDERRKDARVPAHFAVTVYPLRDTGAIMPAQPAK